MLLQLVLFSSVLTFTHSLPTTRIVNGTDALEGQIPYIVSVRKYNAHNCGGSILDTTHIITACHCVQDSITERISIQYGVLLIELGEDAQNRVQVIDYVCHENYNVDGKIENDIALLTLETPLVFSDIVQPIILPKPNNATPENSVATLSGWGLPSDDGYIMKHLQVVELLVYSDNDCEKLHETTGPTNRTYNICAGVPEGGKGQCTGDSGGPLVTSEGVQVGIVSWSVKPCGTVGYPGVYTKLSTYIDWIYSHL